MAFRTTWWWGLIVLLLFPLGAVIYVFRTRWALLPIGVILLGVGSFFAPMLIPEQINLDKHIAMEKGPDGTDELRVTLTGWDKDDYEALKEYPETAVLQMANKDVTDDTLKYLKDMSKLRVIDLNRTQITDKGLKVLAELPALEELRLESTQITDEGFRKYLLPVKSLKKLHLQNTQVLRKTALEWRDLQPDREFSGLPKGGTPKKRS